MLNNEQIVNEIIELYANATPKEYRSLIEKHYLPSDKERAENAEVPTPVKLVDEMLNKIPSHIFENLNKILANLRAFRLPSFPAIRFRPRSRTFI